MIKLPSFKISLLSSLILFPFIGYSEDYFDPNLLDEHLGLDPAQVDLSQFSQENSLPLGQYTLWVTVNQEPQGEYSLNFVKNDNNQVVPELSIKQLATFGIDVDKIKSLRDLPPDTLITDLPHYIDDAKVTVDLSKLRVNISAPQIAMNNQVAGYIPKELLDDGIPAFTTNYMISGNRSNNELSTGKQSSDNLFINLNGGLNAGAWRLRTNMSYAYNRYSGMGNNRTKSSTDFANTAVSRHLYDMGSDLLIGESSTRGELFDSIPFKGVQLASNDQMLPSSLRSFAPNVTGIAQSNAQITIRQNGYVVYQNYVPPGPFSIDDLAIGSNSGALDVTIKEEDGTERTFTVAFASLPIMQRPGGWKYELTAGRYNGGVTVGSKEADFVLANAIYGLPYDITLYGGGIGAQDYWSGIAGLGLSMGNLGAISTDVTHAQATLDNLPTQKGQAYRVRYAKNFVTTNTSVDISGTHYSSQDYYTFNNFNNHNYRYIDDIAPWTGLPEKRQYSISVSQPLNNFGSLYFSGSRYEYWDNQQNITQVSAGYNNSYKGISYGVNYSIDRTKNSDQWPENRQISFNVSVPFSLFSNDPMLTNMSSTYSISHDNNGRTTQQAGLNGNLLNSKLTYGISQSWGNQNQRNSGSLYTNYAGNRGTVSAGYSYSQNYNAFNGSLNGGAIIYSGGLLLGKTMGNSMAIIEAEGAEGTRLTIANTQINAQGQAIYPYLSDYSKNTVGLDVNTLPENVTLKQTSKNVYPTSGAIVKVKFDTRMGYQALINLIHHNGVVPFGAVATLLDDNQDDENTGLVGDDGQLYMSGLPNQGTLRIQWGASKPQSCLAHFTGLDVITPTEDHPIRGISAICVSE